MNGHCAQFCGNAPPQNCPEFPHIIYDLFQTERRNCNSTASQFIKGVQLHVKYYFVHLSKRLRRSSCEQLPSTGCVLVTHQIGMPYNVLARQLYVELKHVAQQFNCRCKLSSCWIPWWRTENNVPYVTHWMKHRMQEFQPATMSGLSATLHLAAEWGLCRGLSARMGSIPFHWCSLSGHTYHVTQYTDMQYTPFLCP